MSTDREAVSEERTPYLDVLGRSMWIAAPVVAQHTRDDADRIVRPMIVEGPRDAQRLTRLAVGKPARHGLPEGRRRLF